MAAESLMANCIAATAPIPLLTNEEAVPEKRSDWPISPEEQEFNTTSRGRGAATLSKAMSRTARTIAALPSGPTKAILPSSVRES